MANYDRLNGTGLTTMLNRLAQLVEPVISILPISKGGTGNADGYIRTGKASNTTAAEASTIEGVNNTVEGKNSHAEGNSNTVNKITDYPNADLSCHVEGYSNTMTAQYSHAEGANNTVTGATAHAEGMNNTVSQQGAHAEGRNNTASGYYSHAEGGYNNATSYFTHAAGSHNNAGYENQSVVGTYNNNKATTLFEVGNGTENARSNAFEVYADGHVNAPGGFYKNGTELVTGVSSFNSRTGAITPTAGDYDATQVNYNSNQTVKQKIDALVTNEASDIAVQQILLKDTVGWIGKNLLPNHATDTTIDGVTFTVNVDGSINVNGTANATIFFTYPNEIFPGSPCILSGCPSGGSMESYCADFRKQSDGKTFGNRDFGEGALLTLPTTELVHYTIRIASGYTANNLTFYPMLRKANITDSTYEPYHESVEGQLSQLSVLGVLGAKNLFKVTAESQTIGGVTFTVNKDSCGNVLNVTANGTSADGKTILGRVELDVGTYKLNGSPKSPNLYDWRFRLEDISTGNVVAWDDGNGAIFTVSTKKTYELQIRYEANVVFNNIVFYPMLRFAADHDDTYQPYAMTNRELTEAAGVWTTVVSCLTGDSSVTINNANIHTTSVIDIYYENSSGTPVFYKNTVVTEGRLVITFESELTESVNIKLKIIN